MHNVEVQRVCCLFSVVRSSVKRSVWIGGRRYAYCIFIVMSDTCTIYNQKRDSLNN